MAITFETISGDYSNNVQNAINGSVATGLPVYGTAGTYTVTSALTFPEGAQLILLPGAIIQWNFNSSSGVIACPVGDKGRSRLWRGGTISSSGTAGGDVFVVDGDLVTLDGVSFTGVRNGAAIRVRGNRCSVITPTISGAGGSLGIVIEKGTGARVVDGSITVAVDAIQIAPTAPTAPNDAPDPVTDVQIEGTTLSAGGSLLEIKTLTGDIRNVQVRGVTGTSTGTSSPAISIRHISGATTERPRITGVSITDATISYSASGGTCINILSRLDAADALISNVTFDNVLVRKSGSSVASTNAIFSASAAGTAPLRGLTWVGGGIMGTPNGDTPPISTFNNRLIAISHANDVILSGLQLSGSTNAQPVSVGIGTNAACANVAFSDVALASVANSTGSPPVTAVAFDQATSCGWTRGSIGGVSGASFTALSFTSDSQGCYVEGADLSRNNAAATKIALPAGSDTRLFGNNGSRQLSAISLGTPVPVALTGSSPATELALAGSAMTVTSGGPLKKITGGVSGDLLVLRATVSLTVEEVPGGNIRLNVASIVLNKPEDTLTLLCDGTNWLQLAFSDNTP